MGLVSSTPERLSEQEIKIVKESWAVVMENPEGNGILILTTFFDKHNYVSAFEKFKGIPLEELHEHPTYKRHALAIIRAIDSVIENLDDDSKVKDGLIALGKQHQKRNLSEQHFLELKEVILNILADKLKLSSEGCTAWNKTFDIALNHVFEGLK